MIHADLAALLAGGGERVLWSSSTQLQSNLVRLLPGEAVPEHVEGTLDVLLVVVAGDGTVSAGTEVTAVTAPAAVVLRAGEPRALTAGPEGLAYVTAHSARTGMSIGR